MERKYKTPNTLSLIVININIWYMTSISKTLLRYSCLKDFLNVSSTRYYINLSIKYFLHLFLKPVCEGVSFKYFGKLFHCVPPEYCKLF